MVQQEITLDQDGQESLNHIEKSGRLTTIFAAAATGAIGLVAGYYGYEAAQGAMTAGYAATEAWRAGMFISLLSGLFYSVPVDSYRHDINYAVKSQRKQFGEAFKAQLSESQNAFIKELEKRQESARALTEDDLDILATFSDEKLKQVPDWVPLKTTSDIADRQKDMASIDQYTRHKFNQCATQKEMPSRQSLANLLLLFAGILPVKHLLSPIKAPDPKIFNVPYPEKPDLKELTGELKAMKKSAPAPSA